MSLTAKLFRCPYPKTAFLVQFLRLCGLVVLAVNLFAAIVAFPLAVIYPIPSRAQADLQSLFLWTLGLGLAMLILMEALIMLRDLAIRSARQTELIERMAIHAGAIEEPPEPATQDTGKMPVPQDTGKMPVPPARVRVPCSLCNAVLVLPAGVEPKPGDVGKCPKCGAKVALA